MGPETLVTIYKVLKYGGALLKLTSLVLKPKYDEIMFDRAISKQLDKYSKRGD